MWQCGNVAIGDGSWEWGVGSLEMRVGSVQCSVVSNLPLVYESFRVRLVSNEMLKRVQRN